MYVCALFSVQGGMLEPNIPPCTENNAHTNHNNGILIILIRDFS
jgi:hypothetical protein